MMWLIIHLSFNVCRINKITEKEENRNKMRYLLGESMGGAVALLLHRKNPHYWDGAILAAPMCKVSFSYYNCNIFFFNLIND